MASTWRQYWHLLGAYLRPQGRSVTLLALLLLGSIGLQLVTPQILGRFIDLARSGALPDLLRTIVLLFIGAVIAGQVVTSLATLMSERVGWTAMNLLRADLALHCLRLPPAFHTDHSPGELIQRVDGDAGALASFFSQFVIRVLGSGLLLLGIIVLVSLQDWHTGLFLAVFTIGALALLARMQRIAVPDWTAHRQAAAELTGFWDERLVGTEDLRANGALAYTMRRHYGILADFMSTGRRGFVMGRVLQATAELLLAFATVAVFMLGAIILRRGGLTLGVLYLLLAYTNLIAWNVLQLTSQLDDFQRAVAAAERIRQLFETTNPLRDGPNAPPPGPLSVEFQGVSFGYASGRLVLDDIDFRLDPGTVLGLLGRTGSGKTTLIRLLARFYDPDQGAIRLNGRDLRDAPVAAIRSRLAVVTQEVQIFRASVRDNLTLFDPQIPDQAIIHSLDELGLGAWHRALPDGLDTELGAGGGLSAGEAQLIALTRVFLHDPDLVILDEASSRLDPATERLIGQAFERLLHNRTAIVIAHRLQTVRRVDRIMILDQGRIVEHGQREALERDPQSRFAHLLRTGLEEVLE